MFLSKGFKNYFKPKFWFKHDVTTTTKIWASPGNFSFFVLFLFQ